MSKEVSMNKSKRSIFTAVSAIALTLINGVFAVVITKLVISKYGSDFNGLNSTATQFVSMLLVIEGGFTLASNVALFRPMALRDYDAINRIISATRKAFERIGLIFLLVGLFASFVFALLVNSELSPILSFLVLSLTVISVAFNLVFSTKYQILLQSEQKEYILHAVKILTVMLSQIMIVVVVFTDGHMLFVRVAVVLGVILNSLLLVLISRKQHAYLDMNVEPDFSAIRGTKDVFVYNITNMVYYTVPVVFIAGTAGTIYASVYVVYNNIFRLLKSVIYSFVNAPRIGFGKLIAEKESDYVLKVFFQYEMVISFVMFVFLSTTAVLIMPFISVYTEGFTDVNYYNWYIAIFLIAITFFEVIHIPSGNIINMAGRFKIGRRIQTVASIVIVVGMILGNLVWGLYGILSAVLITAVLLSVLEITYVHKTYFRKAMTGFFRIIIPGLFVICALTFVEIKALPVLDNYLELAFAGIILVLINALILGLVCYITNRSITIDVLVRVKSLVRRRGTLRNE